MKTCKGEKELTKQCVGGTKELDMSKENIGVVLIEFGPQKIAVIKVVKDLTGRDLKEAKALVDAVALGPQLIAEAASATQGEEIRAKLEAAGAVAIIAAAKNGQIDDPALAEALKTAEEQRMATKKAAAELQARRDAVLALLRDKVEGKLQNFAEDLEIELDWFNRQLTESGVDVALLPEPRVMANTAPSASMLSLVVAFQR